ncbi:hypothetical protein MP989_25470, partial [Escherichia coli]|nr:hypothetical protein [Escherichia coli]
MLSGNKKMIHYRENIYSLDNYERYITDSSLFENTGDGIIYTGIVPLITVVEPVVSNQHSVLIIPGGGYRRIVYEREGLDVGRWGNDSNLLIVFYVQIMPDDLVMQLHR